MALRPLTESDVKGLVRGLIQGGSRVQAEQVQRLWDELKGLRDQQAVSMQLHNLEQEY